MNKTCSSCVWQNWLWLALCGMMIVSGPQREHLAGGAPKGLESSEVVLAIAGREYRYQPRPDLGYVVKLPVNSHLAAAADGDIRLFASADARRVGGIGRRGIWIVETELATGASATTLLSVQGQTRYCAPLFESDGGTVAIIPEIVVRVVPGILAEQLQEVCESLGCTIAKPMEFTVQEYLIEVLGPNEDVVFSAVEELNMFGWIEWAAPNVAFQPKPCGQTEFHAPQVSEISGMIPNDEYLPMQWHLHNTGQFGYTPDADINAIEAWQITTGDPNIVIAIVDDGVDANHPDLANNLVPGYDFQDDDESTHPGRNNKGNANNHGTMCAGLVAAEGNNYIGVIGTAFNCRVMPVRISRTLDSDTYDFITNADKATAFRWAAAHGAHILSNSWGDHNQGNLNLILHSAIVDVTTPDGIGRNGKGCVVLFATGNDDSFCNRETRAREVIAVGATGENDVRRDYSNYGTELDVTAPSGSIPRETQGIMSTDISGDEGTNDYRSGCNGTSTATPIAAGVVALMLSVEPDLTSHEVRHFLTRSARDLGDPGKDDYYGWGRVDARAALDMILAKRCDLNDDWVVDDLDVALFTDLRQAGDLSADIGPAPKPDGILDDQDLDLLMQHWGTAIPKMPEPDLIAHWTLDETEGAVAQSGYDIYGDPMPAGDVHGGALWQPEGGVLGGAIQLDGVDDYISTPVIIDPATGDFSVTAWVKGGAAGQVIVSQQGGVNWLMSDAADGGLRTDLKRPATTGRGATAAGPPLVSSTVVTDGDWHKVGFVRDGTSRILYVDDTEVARDTADTLEPADGGLYIGAGSALDAGTFFSGMIDDVRIYNAPD